MSDFKIRGRVYNALFKFCGKTLKPYSVNLWFRGGAVYATDEKIIVRWRPNIKLITVATPEGKELLDGFNFKPKKGKCTAADLLDFDDDFVREAATVPEKEALDTIFNCKVAEIPYLTVDANYLNDIANLTKAIAQENKAKPHVQLSNIKYGAITALSAHINSLALGEFDIVCMPVRV